MTAVNLDCKDVRVDGNGYDFTELGGPRQVHWVEDQPPSILNTTFTIDICHPLKVVKGIKKEDQCPTGTRGAFRAPNYLSSPHFLRPRLLLKRPPRVVG